MDRTASRAGAREGLSSSDAIGPPENRGAHAREKRRSLRPGVSHGCGNAPCRDLLPGRLRHRNVRSGRGGNGGRDLRQPVHQRRDRDGRRRGGLGERHELDAHRRDDARSRGRLPLRRHRRRPRRWYGHHPGRLVRRFPRRGPGEPLPHAGRDHGPRRDHVRMRRRQLLPELLDHARPDGRLPAARRPRRGLRPAAGLGDDLQRRRRLRLRGRLDRGALRRGHHRRVRHEPPALLPEQRDHARPDGCLPPQGLPRHQLRAAPRAGSLQRRPDDASARALDRGARAPVGHRGLRRHGLLPLQLRHARPDGRLHDEDLPPARGHPIPRAGDLGAERRRDRRGPRPGMAAVAGGAECGRGFDLPELAVSPLAGRHAGIVRRHVLPGQLLVVPDPEPVLHQRALRPRPAAPARGLGAPQDRGRLRGLARVSLPDGAVPAHPRPERVRQLPGHPLPGDVERRRWAST